MHFRKNRLNKKTKRVKIKTKSKVELRGKNKPKTGPEPSPGLRSQPCFHGYQGQVGSGGDQNHQFLLCLKAVGRKTGGGGRVENSAAAVPGAAAG